MALPRQVQAQLAEVEALEEAMRAQRDDGKKDSPVEDTPGQPAVTGEPTDGSQPKAPDPDGVKPTGKPAADVADPVLEQKYRTLQGKYNAEVPRLHQQVKTLTEELSVLKQRLEEKVSVPAKPQEPVSLVTDAEKAEFGEDLLNVQRKVAQEVARDYEAKLEAQAAVIEELRKQVTDTGSQVGEVSFMQRLRELVPDFAQLDQDARWHAWLDEEDEMLLGPRRPIAQAAYDRGDAVAVARYVSLFRKTLPPVEPTQKDTRRAELEKQVAPSRTVTSSRTPPQAASKIYTAPELQAKWDHVRVLYTRGQYAEAEKLEAELTAAQIEGRVR